MHQLLVDLVAHVAHALEVLARVLDPVLGLLAALLVLGDAGGFLQEAPQLFGLRLDESRDHALLDDRVAARPARPVPRRIWVMSLRRQRPLFR